MAARDLTTSLRPAHLADIQAHLRHAQPNVTADVYMQAIPESVRRAVESLDKLLMTSVRIKPRNDFEHNFEKGGK
jgi:hypothetical protein